MIADKGLWGRAYNEQMECVEVLLLTPARERTASNADRERKQTGRGNQPRQSTRTWLHTWWLRLVDFLCEQSVSVAEQIKAGTIKGYLVGSQQRLAVLPDVASAKDAGVKYDMSIWAGIFAPKGVSKEVVDKLAAALNKALDDPAVQKRLADLGGSLPSKAERTPAAFDKVVKAEIARWSPILKAASASSN